MNVKAGWRPNTGKKVWIFCSSTARQGPAETKQEQNFFSRNAVQSLEERKGVKLSDINCFTHSFSHGLLLHAYFWHASCPLCMYCNVQSQLLRWPFIFEPPWVKSSRNGQNQGIIGWSVAEQSWRLYQLQPSPIIRISDEEILREHLHTRICLLHTFWSATAIWVHP